MVSQQPITSLRHDRDIQGCLATCLGGIHLEACRGVGADSVTVQSGASHGDLAGIDVIGDYRSEWTACITKKQ